MDCLHERISKDEQDGQDEILIYHEDQSSR
jgi:hypothetical protein